MADQKISQLTSKTTFSGADYAVIVDNSTVPPTSKKILLSLFPSGGGVTPYSATLNVAYTTTSLPYYNGTASSTATYTLAANGTTSSIAGTISDGVTTVNVTTASGTTVALQNSGLTIGGSAIGTGSDGISRSVPLSGTVAAIPVYIPAFYAQPAASSSPPAFTTASTQTAGAALGSIITYTVPTSSAYYGWIAIPNSLTLANIYVRTVFGDTPLVPNTTAPTQNIGTQAFLVYGFTGFSTNNAVVLVIK